ncbi:MAG TPA: FMN-binding negative transcriptional regulator [Rhodospirillaceae bacterium]|nr:FMN-binding negative transcriptional regulator [Rhodospirillaceae bacterium]
MFNPPQFQENRLQILQDILSRAGLMTLVTLGIDGPEANHLPMLLDPAEGDKGTLYGHLSRANPLWRSPGGPALAIALGPDAYITPSWYKTKQTTGRVVPTWNYVAVHASGPLSFFDDTPSLLTVVRKLTERHEAGRPSPWALDEAPEDYRQAQLKGIVGFKMTIVQLQGKWKMSQNRSAEDQKSVLEGLQSEGRTDMAEILVNFRQDTL